MKSIYCAFYAQQFLIRGVKREVYVYVKDFLEGKTLVDSLLIFNEAKAELEEINLEEIQNNLELELLLAEETGLAQEDKTSKTSKRGRPKLGVTAREITLLPRHWEWLQAQPKSVSASLRLLVEQAIKNEPKEARIKRQFAKLDKIISIVAGNAPLYEEVARALYANDIKKLEQAMLEWQPTLKEYVLVRFREIVSG